MASRAIADRHGVDELTKEFLIESQEGLDRMERCLTELELRPEDQELLSEIFRSVHTIKGTTGFLGFTRLGALAHAGESLLGMLRDGLLRAESETITVLLRLMDGLRVILNLIEKTGGEGTRASDQDAELIALLERIMSSGGSPARTPLPPAADGAPLMQVAEVSSRTDTLRIDVGVLDRLMNLVGELVLTRNQMLQVALSADTFPQLTRRLDSVTIELREAVMQARMQPVGHLFAKFPRLVRDTARECGKEVRLEFSGQETGLDKSLLEAIKDPLTHAVRNAVDHGIETPEKRRRIGKPPEGVVRLKAFHEGGSVVIEVSDDGAGIAIERVLEKAIERGLITAGQAAAMPEREAVMLVFAPGFSTSETITHVSGRGVGMDVVRANVAEAGGSVELTSVRDQGTTLRMRVPLTLAIVPALVVSSGGQNFCLPQTALVELVLVTQRELAAAIERIGTAELYRLRGHLLPLVWLDAVLGLARSTAGAEDGFLHGVYIAVLEEKGCRFGLVVDDLLTPEEIVVKPVSSSMREIGLFSGATVLGSGALALILDAAALAERAGVRALDATAETIPEQGSLQQQRARMLVFEAAAPGGGLERTALPLAQVERIESILPEQIEYAGGRPMLQYRGMLLPLEIGAGGDYDPPAGTCAEMTVLICVRGERRTGLVVKQVLDVAEGTMLAPEPASGRFMELALVNKRITRMHELQEAA